MYANILLPVVLEKDEDFSAPIAVAKALASEGATITLLHVFEQPPAYAMNYIPSDLIAATREGITTALKDAARDLPGGKAVVVTGAPGRSISDWVTSQGVDLVVMSSHRPGMGDIIWGSTAAHVVRHVPCAVHVLR